ncbi:hypothetical protein CO165_02355 [Candidatus Roizmanbacteria bacterium CG_4_9_14_3_um_filter_33_18]|uniref:Uncharacterized protein n=3 Tax=Candidatus Roizmaniibacteriota TaxID=1752723 RepID=A0A2M7UA29_9BACT|nr:MAG: hypothetical protein COW97_01090 [Candidatus Roizmanbacteria bacterium CG22_combo_CG10-13_8_21_14_all_34_12]PIZ68078.1 MAG: hypothetical protein COY12_00710 [Candidatus Roizmanbacteria bacterium CG_4_10_14_0_2_um_filter_33_96]PJA55666.1 MAG: hypothetical protein CO165_02355 [Candidatus Roizmanbacteria bacterium CG_4_9_14_3_um_filter_33_18]
MITDKDVKKLKEVFATKDDLKALDKRFDRIDNNIESLVKDVVTVIEMVGDTNQKLDKINNKITENDDILENHEKRLDKVEDKVF